MIQMACLEPGEIMGRGFGGVSQSVLRPLVVHQFRGHDMERDTAVEIVTYLKALDGPINSAMVAVEKIKDLEQRRAFRRALADVVGSVYTELFVPIGREFPDLLPDEEDREKTSG